MEDIPSHVPVSKTSFTWNKGYKWDRNQLINTKIIAAEIVSTNRIRLYFHR